MRSLLRPNSTRLFLSYAMAIMALAWMAVARAASVGVVLSDDSVAYRETAEAVRSELRRGPGTPPAVAILPLSALATAATGDWQVAVAVGTLATEALARHDSRLPVLGTLLPRASFERIRAESGRSRDPGRFSALFIDQPLGRQLDLIRFALPGAVRVGLLLGPASATLQDALRSAAAERRLRVVVQRANEAKDIYPALQKLLDEVDVLLALPDPIVYNSATVPHVLLATYRQRVPLVGFSGAYTRAGAVLALHSTPEQIGRQAAELLRSGLATGQMPAPQYPRQFVVSTNPHVARSLEIVIEDADSLQRKVAEAAGR